MILSKRLFRSMLPGVAAVVAMTALADEASAQRFFRPRWPPPPPVPQLLNPRMPPPPFSFIGAAAQGTGMQGQQQGQQGQSGQFGQNALGGGNQLGGGFGGQSAFGKFGGFGAIGDGLAIQSSNGVTYMTGGPIYEEPKLTLSVAPTRDEPRFESAGNGRGANLDPVPPETAALLVKPAKQKKQRRRPELLRATA